MEDTGTASDQRTLLDAGAITDSMSPNAEAGSTDAAIADVATTEASTPDANAPDSTPTDTLTPDGATPDTLTPDGATPDRAVADAKPFDTSVTLRHVTGSCDPTERVVGGSATCSPASILGTQPDGADGWRQRCRSSVFEPAPAVCGGGELAAVVQNQRTGTTGNTSVTCGAGTRIIGGGCACGIGNVAASYQNGNYWTCGCTGFGGATQTSTVLCLPDALADGLGLVVVTGGPAINNTKTVTCPAGKAVIGGGCVAAYTSPILGYEVSLLQHRYQAPNSWFCEMATSATTLSAYAYCIDAP